MGPLEELASGPTYAYVWEYGVDGQSAREFERVYGPDGDWAELFRRAEGYLGTRLYRDLRKRDRYLTIDYWRSRDDFRAFRKKLAPEFEALDRRCESLTREERFLGEFMPVGPNGRKYAGA